MRFFRSRHHFIFRFIIFGGSLLDLCGTTWALESGEFRVHTPTPLVDSRLAELACQTLLARFPKFLTTRAQTPQVALLDEVFRQPVEARARLPQEVDPGLSNLAAQVREAQRNNRQLVSSQDPRQVRVSPNAPPTTLSFQFGVRSATHEARIQVEPSTNKGSEWNWRIQDVFPIEPRLFAVHETSPRVTAFKDLGDFKSATPAEVVAAIRSYDLRSEMLGGPHDLKGQSLVRSYENDASAELKFEEPLYFKVTTRQGILIGYLVVQDMSLTHESTDYTQVFRGHFARPFVLADQIQTHTYRYLARFDTEGHRMESWLPESIRPPMGRWMGGEIETTKRRFTHGQVQFANPDRRSLVKLNREVHRRSVSSATQSIDPSPRHGDIELWAQKVHQTPLIRSSRTWLSQNEQLEVSPNGLYTLVASDQQVVLLNLDTGASVIEYGLDDPVSVFRFSRDGREIFVGHPENWLRVIDTQTGNKKQMFSIDAVDGMEASEPTEIVELSDGKIAVSLSGNSSQDERAFLIHRDTGRSSQKFDHPVCGYHKDRVYTFHHFYGLSVFSRPSQSSFDYQAEIPPTAFNEPPFTRRRAHRRLSNSGDHFIAEDSVENSTNLYRLTADGGLEEIFDLRNALGKYPYTVSGVSPASTNQLQDGSSVFAWLSRDGSLKISRIPKEIKSGRLAWNLSLEFKRNEVSALALSSSGRLVAAGHREIISIWRVDQERAIEVRRIKIKNVGSFKHLQFSQDELSIVFVDKKGRLGSVRAQPDKT